MAALRIGVLGINFLTADLQLREAIARGAESLADKRSLFFPHPTVLLSTCNRTEIYFASTDLPQAHGDLLAYLRNVIEEPFEHRLYSYFGIDCFAHLCKVTAGLDSAIFAETEIQRQVKLAYSRSSQLISLPASLHYIFQKALKVGKLIRTEQNLEKRAPIGLYGTLWNLTEWKNKKILLVGYSEINRGFASFLHSKGIDQFAFCTKALHLEGAYDRSILEHWQAFDVIVCASKSEGYLIYGKGSQKNCIFDLSVPRNVDPEVGKSAILYNIDQLTQQEKNTNYLEEWESLIWQNVVKLTRLYHAKTRHALEIVETESRL
jgi:glutamyl-tRNA reductase